MMNNTSTLSSTKVYNLEAMCMQKYEFLFCNHNLGSPFIHQGVELSSTSYLNVRAVRHNLLRDGNLASGVSSLRSTSSGMNSEAGSGGSGDDGNGNDVGTCGGKCSNDGGGGNGGEGIYGNGDDQGDSGDGGGDGGVGATTYSAMLASIDGDIGGSSLTVFRALRRCV
ncbi:hypothetical protein Tco_0819425 [Tanacetum coccineum]|uniref:Uncharacterized protein n=1 Tax=Tanacetum coccineum TaxID=301880 RepID=A0ABQ5A7G7_9ASTR